jgi:anti-sigma factor RsiW
MSCKEMQDLIHGYLDGELGLVRSLEIEQHFQDCQDCTQTYTNHQALRSALNSGSLYFKPPASLQKRIRSAVRTRKKGETRLIRLSWGWLAVGASLAAVALLILSFAPVLTGPSQEDLLTQEIIAGHVRSLMADHLTDVSSSDQHTVKPWFSGKLDFSPQVKDLAGHGFPLVGGRLDYLGNKPVAALVYQHRQHFINLFIWPSSNGSWLREQTRARQGYNLIHWTRSDMTYWTISDLNLSELHNFVQLLQNDTSPTMSP